MSSFFLKKKPKEGSKRKVEAVKKSDRKSTVSKSWEKKEDDQEDEIDSDEAFSDPENESHNREGGDTDEEMETPQDKRLRLAKQYLEEVKKEEERRAEDKDLDDTVSKRLRTDYLESIGKLRKNIGGSIRGFKAPKILKHKKQKLPMTTVLVSDDGNHIFSGAKTSIVVKWDPETLKPIGSFDVAPHTEDQRNDVKRRPHIISMCISSDNKFLALADGGNNIQIWCPQELKHLRTLKGHRDSVQGLVFRRDTHDLYSASKDRSVKIWSIDEMAYVESLFGHQAAITGIDALSRERAITSGGVDCSVRIWKITEESQLIFNAHSGSIENVKFINDENFVSSGSDGSICLWSAIKKKPLFIERLTHGSQSNGDANWISAIATVVNTDLIASGSSDGFVRLWKMTDYGKKLEKLLEIPVEGFVNSLAFSNGGKQLLVAVGQEHRLGRWWRMKNVKNAVMIFELEYEEKDVKL